MKGNSILMILCLGILLLILAVMLLPEINPAGESGQRISCISNLKQIGLALKQYAMDNDGIFPPYDGDKGLDMLRQAGYLTDCKIYTCPSTSDTGKNDDGTLNSSYIYRGGLTENDSPDSAIAWEKPNNHNCYGNILFIDGHVQGFAGYNWVRKAK